MQRFVAVQTSCVAHKAQSPLVVAPDLDPISHQAYAVLHSVN
jgi:hypothetical protein